MIEIPAVCGTARELWEQVHWPIHSRMKASIFSGINHKLRQRLNSDAATAAKTLVFKADETQLRLIIVAALKALCGICNTTRPWKYTDLAEDIIGKVMPGETARLADDDLDQVRLNGPEFLVVLADLSSAALVALARKAT